MYADTVELRSLLRQSQRFDLLAVGELCAELVRVETLGGFGLLWLWLRSLRLS